MNIPPASATIIIIAGVSGSGKTTIGLELAKHLHAPFVDGDDLHTESNIAKMKSGIPLDDSDRLPWLNRVREKAVALINGITILGDDSRGLDDRPRACVIACSALKRKYREILRGNRIEQTGSSSQKPPSTQVIFIYLKGPPGLIASRMKNRENHFMSPAMLESQIDTLEEPDPNHENSDQSKIIIMPLLSQDGQPKPLNKLVDEALDELVTKAGIMASFQKPFPSLPALESLFTDEPEKLAETLALLFEVSSSIKQKLIPILREEVKEIPDSYDHLIDLCEKIVKTDFNRNEQINFLASHPRIGEVKGLSKLSSKEQGHQTDPKILARLEELNNLYETTYPGLRYVTFVNGRSRGEIVEEMEALLIKESSPTVEVRQQDPRWQAELERGLGDVFQIAKSRLKAING